MKRTTSASPQATKKPRLDDAEVDKEKATMELHQHQYQNQNRYQHLDSSSNSLSGFGTDHNLQSGTASETTIVDDMSPAKITDADRDANDTHGWKRVEKRKMKKVRNLELKMSNNPPRFSYSIKGINAKKEPVNISDLREFIIHLIGSGPAQTWLQVENRASIGKVVALQIPGLTNSILNIPPLPTNPTVNPHLPIAIPNAGPSTSPSSPPSSPQCPVPFISQTFMHALPTRAPGEPTKMHSVLGSFFMGPVSAEEKKRRVIARAEGERKAARSGGGKEDPSSFVLSAEEMCLHEYPIPSYMADVGVQAQVQLEAGWVESPEVKEKVEKEDGEEEGEKDEVPDVFVLDCEMCQTEDGKELTRVCVVDYHTEKVLLDELVKPVKPILDYLTRFSGITAEHLSTVTTTLPVVQASLLRVLTSRTILVGHSLEQDLRALKLAHPRCIDTALLYHHPRGPPLKPGLAWLTKKWCNRDIQNHGVGGHDPEEDARACLELVKKKLLHGPGYGEFKLDQESILERLGRATTGVSGGVKTAVVDYGNPSTWHGAKATIAIACKSDQDVVNGVIECIGQCQFIFGRFMELSEALGWSSKSQQQQAEQQKQSPIVDMEQTLSSLDTRLKAIHNALPPRTALIIFSGHSDPRTMASLNQRKSKFENDIRAGKTPEDISKEGGGWTTSDARALEEETAKARRGLAFLCLKS